MNIDEAVKLIEKAIEEFTENFAPAYSEEANQLKEALKVIKNRLLR